MKNTIQILALFAFTLTSYAQEESALLYNNHVTINDSMNNINANNIDAAFMASGLHFWGGDNIMGFEVPKGSNNHTIFCNALWVGGLDENNELHLAADRYRQYGKDYQAGPISAVYDSSYFTQWNKIWKLEKNQIQYHKEHWWEVGYILIDEIATWPAHGDVSLGQAVDLAPYNDMNNNSVYDPENGDYPSIPGDQALFFIFNDDITHEESQGDSLRIEIHGMAYSFSCPQDSAFNNTVFLKYEIINYSDNIYHDLYVGNFTDFDIGNHMNDYVGCDTIVHSFFAYNGTSTDEPGTWNPESYYGNHPPAQAISFLNVEMNAVVSFNNNNPVYFDPIIATEFYNILKGYRSNGSSINPNNPAITYSYPGDPAIPGEDSELTHENPPGDRRSTGSSGPYTLEQGDKLSIEVAFVFGRDYYGDNITSVANMKERIQHIRNYYNNNTTPCGTQWSAVSDIVASEILVSVYPNPATDVLNISSSKIKDFNYVIFNIAGEIIIKEDLKGNYNSVDISKLTNGIYMLKINSGDRVQMLKFVKE